MTEELNVLGRTKSGMRGGRHSPRLHDGRPQCQGEAYQKVGRFGEWMQCSRAGKVLAEAPERAPGREDGKLYYFCQQHSPEGIAARKAKSDQRWSEHKASDKRKWARDDAVREILAALKVDDIESARAAYRKYEENAGVSPPPTDPFPGIFDAAEVRLRSNHLFYGDNLTIMRRMPSASVDLIYLDPPFNSQRNYNLIYKRLTGQPVPEQEEAFCDAWDMDQEKEEMARQMPGFLRKEGVPEDVVAFWDAWITALRRVQPRLLAYLIYMAYRLFEMRRILKPTGSIYLHCDPGASHYIKIIMDGVFGHTNFRNEILWKRTSSHNSAKRYAPVHDVILYYTKSNYYTWNGSYTDLDPGYVERFYRFKDSDGRRFRLSDLTAAGTRNGESGQPWRGIDPTTVGRHWVAVHSTLDEWDSEGRIYWPPRGSKPSFKRFLDEMRGQPAQDIWTDVPVISSQAKERLGYPTQKPIALLERIVKASSNPGDVVFDPFAGCGTAVYAAHLNGRQWIGCDIAILSVRIMRDVLLHRYGLVEGQHYTVSGVPLSVEGASELFSHDARQFQHWAVELAGGFASTKYSGDRGIDGRIHFETKDGLRNMVISVKGGHVAPAFVRELSGTVQHERKDGTEMGGLICLQPITKGMREAAATGGMFGYLGKDYDRIQLRTVEDLLAGRGFDTPSKVQTMGWQQQGVLPL